MKNLIAICILGASLALVSCGETEKLPIEKISEPSSEPQKPLPTKTGIFANITGLENSGKDCIIRTEITNMSGETVDLFQFSKYTVIHKGGEGASYGGYTGIENKETATRSGFFIGGASCSDVLAVRIDELICKFERDPKTMLNPSCAQLVVLKGSKQVKLTLKP